MTEQYVPQYHLLKKLAAHLRKGKFGHEIFTIQFFNAGLWEYNTEKKGNPYAGDERLHLCGTMGCALGECPFVFQEWFFVKSVGAYPVIKEAQQCTFRSAEIFFNMSYDAVRALFTANSKAAAKFGIIAMGINATPTDVASTIKTFIKNCQTDPEVLVNALRWN